METIGSFLVALFLSLGVHEGGHMATVIGTGGEITAYKGISVEYTGGSDEVYLGSFASQYVALDSLTRYRSANPDKDNEVLEYMTWFALADLPLNCVLSEFDNSNDVAKWSEATGNSKAWIAGVALLQTTLYFNDVKEISLKMAEEGKGLMAIYNHKF